MFPVRCYTCNAILAHLETEYKVAKREQSWSDVVCTLNLQRICCRRMFLGHVETEVNPRHGNVDTALSPSCTLHRHISHERTVSCD